MLLAVPLPSSVDSAYISLYAYLLYKKTMIKSNWRENDRTKF